MGLEIRIDTYDCVKPVRMRPFQFVVGTRERDEILKLGVGSAAYANLRRSMCPDCPIGCPKRSLADAIKAEAVFPKDDRGDVE